MTHSGRLSMRDEKGASMTRTTISKGTLAGLAAAVALGGLPGAMEAQEPNTRLGWQAYLGCWARPANNPVDVDRPEEEAVDDGVLCFVASGEDVEMVTIVDGAITHREPFPADGQPRMVEQDGCTGTETSRFSHDQRRIYVTSEATCQDGAPRRSTGIISMPGPSEWLDVRAMEVDGRATAWAQWYQRTSDSALREVGLQSGEMEGPVALRAAGSYLSSQITVDDVIDASHNVHPEAVSAWLAQAARPFARLDADALIRLDDAGVPGSVIDVVVAISFPQRFALNREDLYADDYGEVGGVRAARTIWVDRLYSPFYSGYGYGYYPYRSYYGWSGYGWGYPGRWYGGGGYYRPVVVNVTPRSGGGRVVAGRGYRGPRTGIGGTRGGSTTGAWVGSSGGTRSGSGVSRGGSGSSGGSRSARPRRGGDSVQGVSSSSGSSRPTASSRPPASRSSGSSTGRKARPRRGGK